MFRIERYYRRALRPVFFATMVFATSWLAPSAAEAQLGFNQPGLQTVTVTKTPLGPDRGYAYSASSSSGADLLSISKLILRLTRQLVNLVDSGHGSRGDFELGWKLIQLRQAFQQQRQLQMAQRLEQAVDEMIAEDAEAARQGREPTQQEAEQRVRDADKEIAENRQALELLVGPSEAPNDETKKGTAVPPNDEQAARDRATRILNEILVVLDDPHRPTIATANPLAAIQTLNRIKSSYLAQERGPLASTPPESIRAIYDEVFDPVIKQMEEAESSGMAWIETGAKLIESSPQTKAERAETEARQVWRREDDRLKKELDDRSSALRDAERAFLKDGNSTNRGVYKVEGELQLEAMEKLKAHRIKFTQLSG